MTIFYVGCKILTLIYFSFVSLFPAMLNIYLGRVPIHSSNTIWCRLRFGWIIYIWVVSAYTMLSVSLTRYFVIAKSNQLPSVFKNHPNLCILIFNWILPLIVVFPPVAGFWGCFNYWEVTGLCYPDFTYRKNIYQITYIIIYFLLVPILCLCTISISYRLILHETREKRRKIDEHTREHAVRSYIVANVFNTPDEEFIHFSREKHEKLLSKHLVHIFITCLCTMIPMNIALVIHFFCASSASRQLIIIGIILAHIADITNQFCYYLRNRDHFFTVLATGITKSNKVTCESDIKPSLET